MPSPLTLSSEARVVFRSAAGIIPAAELDALCARVTDWPRLFGLAEYQVASLAVWKSLQAAPASLERVPDAFAEGMRRLALVGDLRMQHLARRAQQSVEALSAAGVQSLLLKGAALGALRDPTFRSRPMTDVDLLVRRSDVAKASEALLGAGWKVTENKVYLEMLKDAHHLPHFVDPSLPGMRLELHVALMPDDQPFGITEDSFWASARPAPAPFAGAMVPSPTHLLLHTAVHYAWQHTLVFGGWRTFRAVQLILELPDLDWDAFVAEAKATKSATCAYWTLRLAATLCGISVPPRVLESLEPPTAELLRRPLERHYVALNAPGESTPSPSEKLTRYLWYAALRPRWSGHADPGRYDPEHKWEKAYGTASTETASERYLRHMKNASGWSRYLRETLLG